MRMFDFPVFMIFVLVKTEIFPNATFSFEIKIVHKLKFVFTLLRVSLVVLKIELLDNVLNVKRLKKDRTEWQRYRFYFWIAATVSIKIMKRNKSI